MKLSYLKLWSNDRGFSLMEVMLGGTLMVGLGLAGARMMKQQKSTQQKTNYDINLSQFHQGFVKTFNMSHNCNATLKEFYGYPVTPKDLASVSTCTTSDCQNLTYVKNDANSVSLSTSINPGVAAWIDDQEIWALKKFSIRGGPYTETSNISLRVTYSLNPRLGSKDVTKEFFVNARFYNGGFKECLSGQESSMNNLQNDFCKSMNQALLDQGSGIVASWDEASQTCVKKDNVKTCPAGQTIKGVNPDGSVTCQSINSGFTGASGAQATCVAGQTPKAVFNPTTKAFNMVCDGTATTGGTTTGGTTPPATTCPEGASRLTGSEPYISDSTNVSGCYCTSQETFTGTKCEGVCRQAAVTWTIGGKTCSGTSPQMLWGTSATVPDSEGPDQGVGMFHCSSIGDSWGPPWYSNSGSSCSGTTTGGTSPAAPTSGTPPSGSQACFITMPSGIGAPSFCMCSSSGALCGNIINCQNNISTFCPSGTSTGPATTTSGGPCTLSIIGNQTYGSGGQMCRCSADPTKQCNTCDLGVSTDCPAAVVNQ